MFNIAIIGLGYVGLPLFKAFDKKGYNIIGIDSSEEVLLNIKDIDSKKLYHTKDISKLLQIFQMIKIDNSPCIFISCVPTPVYNETPIYDYIDESFKFISKFYKDNDIVINESTVAIGKTREYCKKYNFKNYSFCPERISPYDKSIEEIVKLVSGNNQYTLDIVEKLYSSIIPEVYKINKENSIEIAESSKLLENIQRDVNISLINEFSVYCDKHNISIQDTIDLCKTKWNFNEYRPGLVGGTCIPYNPYFAIDDSRKLGWNLDVISVSRKSNEYMNKYIFNFIQKYWSENSQLLFLGSTYKKDCPSFQNSQSLKIYSLFKELYGSYKIDIFDPYFESNINKIEDLDIYEKYKSICKLFNTFVILIPHTFFIKNIDLLYGKKIIDPFGYLKKYQEKFLEYNYL